MSFINIFRFHLWQSDLQQSDQPLIFQLFLFSLFVCLSNSLKIIVFFKYLEFLEFLQNDFWRRE